MKKINYITLVSVIFFVTLFAFLIRNSFSYMDNDLGWHLKVGQEILAEKKVPTLEYYNYTMEGRTWVDHEWLINLVTFAVYDSAGYFGLTIFFALIVLITLALLFFYRYSDFRFDPLYFFALALLGVFASAPHFGIRMQEISLLFLMLLLILIDKFNKDRKRSLLLLLLPMFYLWSMLHAGFLIGLFILFLWLVYKTAEKYLANKSWRIKEYILLDRIFAIKEIANVFIASFGAFLITLFTPYGLELYGFLKGYGSSTYYMTNINEWLPLLSHPVIIPQLFYVAFTLICISVMVHTSCKRNLKLDLWHVGLTVLFIFLSFKSKRHFPLLFIISLPLLIHFLVLEFGSITDRLKGKSFGLTFVKTCLALSLIFVGSVSFVSAQTTNDPFGFYRNSYPVEAIAFLKENKDLQTKRIFNEYSWGGYMIWAIPEMKLFIDGRLPQVEYKGHTFLEEYHEFFKEEKVKDKLEEHQIELVLIQPKRMVKFNWFEKLFLLLDEEKASMSKNHLDLYLSTAKDWQLVHSDELSKVYLKK